MSVSNLERWCASRCDGDWEHSYGVQIDTLDNPGWSIKIDLRDTPKQGHSLEKNKISRGENNWVEKQQFRIACAPLNLSEAIEVFVEWFDSE